jgi:hypothetical protein
MASKWKLILVSASIPESPRNKMPRSALSAQYDKKYPIPGVFLPELWMKLGSKAIEFSYFSVYQINK